MNINQKGFANIILIVVIVAIVAVGGYFVFVKKSELVSQTTTKPQESVIENQVRIAVEKVLSQGTLANPNEQMPKGVKLLSVSVFGNEVTLNFSKEITSKGQGVFEDIFSLVSNTVHPIIQDTNKDPEYPELVFTVLVEGKPINNYQSNNQIPRNLSSQQPKEIVEADIKNLADLLNTRVYIAFYYEKYNKYPKVEGNTAAQRWENLNNLLTKESENFGFINPISLPQDSRHKEKGFSYDYQASSNQQQAVFKVILEAPDHQDVKTAIEVNNDVDGIIFGIDCDKPNYCLIIR